MARELLISKHPAIRNNIIVILCNLAIRYSAKVDPYISSISSCLKDESLLVSKQTLTLLARLLQEDYIKWRGSLFFHCVSCLVDSDLSGFSYPPAPGQTSWDVLPALRGEHLLLQLLRETQGYVPSIGGEALLFFSLPPLVFSPSSLPDYFAHRDRVISHSQALSWEKKSGQASAIGPPVLPSQQKRHAQHIFAVPIALLHSFHEE